LHRPQGWGTRRLSPSKNWATRPFDWQDFLRLANELALKGDEASKRTAIGRAYYFAFNVAFARAQLTAGKIPPGENSHRWCWERYASASDKRCHRIFLLGDRMKRNRINADYVEADIPRLDDVVRRVLLEARELQQDIAALDPTQPLP